VEKSELKDVTMGGSLEAFIEWSRTMKEVPKEVLLRRAYLDGMFYGMTRMDVLYDLYPEPREYKTKRLNLQMAFRGEEQKMILGDGDEGSTRE
jgi:hypothetical protein